MESRYDKQAGKIPEVILDAPYSEVCADPRGFLRRVVAFAHSRGIKVTEKENAAQRIPEQFRQSKASLEDEDSRMILATLEQLIGERGEITVPLLP